MKRNVFVLAAMIAVFYSSPARAKGDRLTWSQVARWATHYAGLRADAKRDEKLRRASPEHPVVHESTGDVKISTEPADKPDPKSTVPEMMKRLNEPGAVQVQLVQLEGEVASDAPAPSEAGSVPQGQADPDRIDIAPADAVGVPGIAGGETAPSVAPRGDTDSANDEQNVLGGLGVAPPPAVSSGPAVSSIPTVSPIPDLAQPGAPQIAGTASEAPAVSTQNVGVPTLLPASELPVSTAPALGGLGAAPPSTGTAPVQNDNLERIRISTGAAPSAPSQDVIPPIERPLQNLEGGSQ